MIVALTLTDPLGAPVLVNPALVRKVTEGLGVGPPHCVVSFDTDQQVIVEGDLASVRDQLNAGLDWPSVLPCGHPVFSALCA